jgi:hypothetical protein
MSSGRHAAPAAIVAALVLVLLTGCNPPPVSGGPRTSTPTPQPDPTVAYRSDTDPLGMLCWAASGAWSGLHNADNGFRLGIVDLDEWRERVATAAADAAALEAIAPEAQLEHVIAFAQAMATTVPDAPNPDVRTTESIEDALAPLRADCIANDSAMTVLSEFGG